MQASYLIFNFGGKRRSGSPARNEKRRRKKESHEGQEEYWQWWNDSGAKLGVTQDLHVIHQGWAAVWQVWRRTEGHQAISFDQEEHL
jgi:hypothetical protein